MNKQITFNFNADLSKIDIPLELNNPFGGPIPEIAKIAAGEFQDFIAVESKKWDYDFTVRNGKMFGVLVVQKKDSSFAYLGTISGKISRHSKCNRFVQSVFDNATDDFFIDKGMTELSEIINQTKMATNPTEIALLKEKSKQKSIALQQRLFENYHFSNLSGIEKNLLEIFKDSAHGKPPAAAGECAAPKLLQYAIEHHLKPIALAEFWWGNPIKNSDKLDKAFYPACKDRCRPILEYMLEDSALFNNVNSRTSPEIS